MEKTSKWLVYIPVILLVLILILAGFLYLSPKKQVVTPTPTPSKTSFSGKEGQVNITKDGFMPATIAIKKGGNVTFTNTDTNPHQIAFDSKVLSEEFENETLSTNESLTLPFDQTGTYTYHDQANSKIEGIVVVE